MLLLRIHTKQRRNKGHEVLQNLGSLGGSIFTAKRPSAPREIEWALGSFIVGPVPIANPSDSHIPQPASSRLCMPIACDLGHRTPARQTSRAYIHHHRRRPTAVPIKAREAGCKTLMNLHESNGGLSFTQCNPTRAAGFPVHDRRRIPSDAVRGYPTPRYARGFHNRPHRSAALCIAPTFAAPGRIQTDNRGSVYRAYLHWNRMCATIGSSIDRRVDKPV